MGLKQSFIGLAEPDDRELARAPAARKKACDDASGSIMLHELTKQPGRGVGANDRAMKARIRAVFPDGADGPVMEPYYNTSTVIMLADFKATDIALTLSWHAGTGHRQHKRARKAGKKPAPFGDILGYHADCRVSHAPVRDMRLCKARTANVSVRMRPWRRAHKPIPKARPAGTNCTPTRQARFTSPPSPSVMPMQRAPDGSDQAQAWRPAGADAPDPGPGHKVLGGFVLAPQGLVGLMTTKFLVSWDRSGDGWRMTDGWQWIAWVIYHVRGCAIGSNSKRPFWSLPRRDVGGLSNSCWVQWRAAFGDPAKSIMRKGS